jgi:uncharacterized DUF497 family protein
VKSGAIPANASQCGHSHEVVGGPAPSSAILVHAMHFCFGL